MEQAKKKESVVEENRRRLSSSKDDSLTDFKSPKLEQVVQSKIQIVNHKTVKKLNSKGKTSSKKKKEAVGKKVVQPSIESSFFKAAIYSKRGGHTCPLCMKHFADTNAGISHSKSCAAKYKVSTKKLLAAVALQERQADERVAIGLPAGPIVQPKETTLRKPRETTAKGDSDLQLALALSKSLQENQVEQEFEEALLLAGEHQGDGRIRVFPSDSERKKTLTNFGFITNKPEEVAKKPVRTRRKKYLGPTILQTRTKETRDRLLTDRIAEILMGNEAITQVCQEETTAEVNFAKKQQIILRSHSLKEIHRTTNRLWDCAQLATSVTNFYVKDLAPVIVSDDLQKQENPEFFDVEFSTFEEIDRDKNKVAPTVLEEFPVEEDDKQIEKMSESSEELEQINEGAMNRLESPKPNDIHVTDRQYRNTLPMDWANTLNVSFISDVVILVKDNHIWAHKLVFHVRCSDILLDCETNSDTRFSHVKEKISWLDVDLSTGLAFLEFVYSGLIEKNIGLFTDSRVASGVRRLARKYRVKALFDYLRRKQVEFDQFNNATEEVETRRSGLRSPIVIEDDADRESSPSSPSKKLDVSANTETNTFINKTGEANLQSRDTDAMSVVSVVSSHSRVSMSPDLFDETTKESTADTAKNSEEFEENPDLSANDNSNLKVLADLIAQEDLSLCTEASGRSTASTIVQDKISNESPSIDETNVRSSLLQSYLDTPKSRNISTFVEAAKINEGTRSQLFPDKQKSNLSLFIEKVKRINAKGALDSYTEEESLAGPSEQKRRRNPFNVNKDNDISSLHSSERMKNKRGCRRENKRGLSVFERQFKFISDAKENFNESVPADNSVDANKTSQAEESSIVDDTVNTDNEDTSMYSKYRKKHKQNNSISKYRNMLKKLENATVASESYEKSDNVSSLNETAIDLTQESDIDDDISLSPMSGAPRSSERNDAGDASGSDSIHSASTAIVHFTNSSASSDDEESKDAEPEDASASSSTKEKIDRRKAKGKNCLKVSDVYSEDTKDYDSSSTDSRSRIKKTKEDKTKRASSVDDLNKNEEKFPQYSIDTTSESVKSLRNSPRYSNHNLLEEVDDEIFLQSWKNKTSLNLSPRSYVSPGESLSSEIKQNNEEIVTMNDSDDDNLKKDEEAARYHTTNRSSKSTGSSRKSPEYSDLDVFEIDEEMFTESFKKSYVSQQRSFTTSPKRSFDYSDKSASFRRKQRAEEKRTKATSFDYNLETKSPANTSAYPDIDVDDLFTQSLRNTDEIPRRSLTPIGNRSSDYPEKSASSRRKRKSNSERKKVRKSFIDYLERNKSDKSSEDETSPKNSSKYHYEVFEPDNQIFTQSFNASRLSPDRALSPSPSCASPSKKSNQPSTLKVPSPIVISSSPEIDAHNEINYSNYEQDCNKENQFSSDRGSPLLMRKNLENSTVAISLTNLERSTIFSRESLQDSAEENSPSTVERPTTPQPGPSRKYCNREDFPSSTKTPLIRWNSMPTSSSSTHLPRKESRTQKISSRLVLSQAVTPPVNYDTMDTPELKKELEKYGIKPQKRNRARQLLTHIYNELHPVVEASSLENNSDDGVPLSDDKESPAKKIRKLGNETSEDSDSDEALSQQSVTSAASVIPEETDFADDNVSPDDSNDSASTSSIKKAFNALIKEDEEMYNKVLTYEPLPLDLLHLMLKTRGFKCKCKNLMDFLDEECITFQVQAQRTRIRKTQGKKTAPSGKRKANSQKS